MRHNSSVDEVCPFQLGSIYGILATSLQRMQLQYLRDCHKTVRPPRKVDDAHTHSKAIQQRRRHNALHLWNGGQFAVSSEQSAMRSELTAPAPIEIRLMSGEAWSLRGGH